IIFDYALRTGFVVAVVLATRNCGVWGDGAETEEIYNNAIVQAKPYAQQATEKLNIEMPAMPAQRQISFFGVYCYNQSVLAFFNLLNKCPHYINSFVEDMPGLFEQISQ
ncbi:CG7603, partial [Drosophila busckii]